MQKEKFWKAMCLTMSPICTDVIVKLIQSCYLPVTGCVTNIQTYLEHELPELKLSLCSRIIVCDFRLCCFYFYQASPLNLASPPLPCHTNTVRTELQLAENKVSYQVWAAWAKAPTMWGLHVNRPILSKPLKQSKSLRCMYSFSSAMCWSDFDLDFIVQKGASMLVRTYFSHFKDFKTMSVYEVITDMNVYISGCQNDPV